MRKYAGKEDYTQEDLNMIAGCGFDDITAQVQENTQALRRIETELQQLRNMAFTLDQIRSAAQDLDKNISEVFKVILFIQHDLINARLDQRRKEDPEA